MSTLSAREAELRIVARAQGFRLYINSKARRLGEPGLWLFRFDDASIPVAKFRGVNPALDWLAKEEKKHAAATQPR
jgi:hypothetical protein